MKNIRQVLDVFSGHKEKRKGRASKKRIDDLFVKLYHYNDKISVPLPNLYAENEIKKYFGGEDKIDFDNPEHIGRLLFILRNQENDKTAYYSKHEQNIEVRQIMQSIPQGQKENYSRALYEMFMGLKKNSLRRQKDILLQALDLLKDPQAQTLTGQKPQS